MHVHIDHDLCTGDGICEEICPEIFEVREDGLAYVRDDDVPADLEDAVREAAAQCPSEAIVVGE